MRGGSPLHHEVLNLAAVVLEELEDAVDHLGFGGPIHTEGWLLELENQVIGGHVAKVLVGRDHLDPTQGETNQRRGEHVQKNDSKISRQAQKDFIEKK